MIFLMACSAIQLIAPSIYRGFVIPYSGVSNYTFSISRTGETAAVLRLNNFTTDYYKDKAVIVQVREVSGTETVITDLSPQAPLIYTDTALDKGSGTMNWCRISDSLQDISNLSREITDLSVGKWYMWLVLPAYEVT
jgi:hypothetical protein